MKVKYFVARSIGHPKYNQNIPRNIRDQQGEYGNRDYGK
jgi:hypothetical protein